MSRTTTAGPTTRVFRAVVTRTWPSGVYEEAFGPYANQGLARAAATRESKRYGQRPWPSRVDVADIEWRAAS